MYKDTFVTSVLKHSLICSFVDIHFNICNKSTFNLEKYRISTRVFYPSDIYVKIKYLATELLSLEKNS